MFNFQVLNTVHIILVSIIISQNEILVTSHVCKAFGIHVSFNNVSTFYRH